MMERKIITYTPGEWVSEELKNRDGKIHQIEIRTKRVGNTARMIAHIDTDLLCCCDINEEDRANANLITKAPVLESQNIGLMKRVEQLQKQVEELEGFIRDTLGTYNTPDFLKYLHHEKVNIQGEYKKQNSGMTFLIMFIGFYKSWLKRKASENVDELLAEEG